MLSEDDGAGRWVDGRSVHLLLCHGVKSLCLRKLPVFPVGWTLQLLACETAKGLFFFGPKSGGIQTAHHEQELVVWEGLMHHVCDTGLRCCCVWERRRRRRRGGGSAKGVDEAKLVDRQVKRAVVRASVDRDVSVGRKDNRERGSVGGGDARQNEDNGLARENGDAINRHDISTDVLASHVSDAGSRGSGGNA